MMTMYSTHGLFLTCTQQIICIYTTYTFYIYIMYKQSSLNPLATIKEPRFTYLEGQLLARGDKFPSTLVPSLVTTAPPLGFYPFHHFPIPQSPLHYFKRQHQQSWSSSSGTVFLLVQRKNQVYYLHTVYVNYQNYNYEAFVCQDIMLKDVAKQKQKPT